MKLVRVLLCLVALGPASGSGAGPAGHGQPPPPLSAVAIDTLRQRLHDSPLPVSNPGRFSLQPARSWRGSADLFAQLPAPPHWDDKVIAIESGTWRLEDLARRLDDPARLNCVATSCTLRSALGIAKGAELVIDGLDLRLVRGHGAVIHNFGRLHVSDATVSAWDEETDTLAETDGEGAAFRPYIAGFANSHTVLRRSDLLHLGHQGPMSYGLSFGTVNRSGTVTEHPSVDMIGNRLMDVYFGFYSYDADGVHIIDNHIAESHVYGIDPHDDTRNMIIHGNYVIGSRRSHGIILSRRIHNTVVSHNVSVGNGKAGFFLDKACFNVTLAENDSFLNKGEGLVLHEVTRVDVIGNRLHRNGADGLRMRASSEVRVEANIITANRKLGIRAYDWMFARRPPNAEEAGQIVPMSFGMDVNRFSGNADGACRTAGGVSVHGGQLALCLPPALGSGS